MREKILVGLMILAFIVVVISGIILIGFLSQGDRQKAQSIQDTKLVEVYEPIINPAEFISGINHRYLAFTPGMTYAYQGKTEEGIETIEVYVTNMTKKVMGVDAMVVLDRVWLDNELIEETYDWYAQDKYGNVWYFGEDTKEIAGGKVVSTKGSWEAGVNNAKPGIVMKAILQVGDRYRQEYLKGEAEDMGEVVALGVQVNGDFGDFSDCVQIRDWTPLEPDADEYKYYCSEARGLVYETGIKNGEAIQLIDIIKDTKQPEESSAEPIDTEAAGITEQEAITIARGKVMGEVTDVAIEYEYGRFVYVIEVQGEVETDVFVDMETGEVLGIET